MATTAQLQCTERGGPFKIVEVLKPAVASDEVLIRQRAIALNDLDRKQRDFGILIEKWPHILGIEGAGTIEAVGSKVHDFQPGDEVLAWAAGMAHGEDWGGSYQEHVVIPEYFVAKKPKGISIEEAASLPVCFNTAVMCILLGLKIALPFIPGTVTTGTVPTSVLILGGSSGTGASAIQLLRLAYPTLPVFVTSSPKHHDHLISLGATKVFDRGSSTLISDIKAVSPGCKGIDMIVDCVGAGAVQTDICDVFDAAGSMIYAASLTGADVSVPDNVKKIPISGWPILEVQGGKQIIQAITKLVDDGRYKVPLPVKVAGHGLDQLADVVDKLKTVSGEKLIVTL